MLTLTQLTFHIFIAQVVVVKVVEEETGSCVRWEGGQNRVLDLELSDQKQTPELLEVPCWWGVKPKVRVCACLTCFIVICDQCE